MQPEDYWGTTALIGEEAKAPTLKGNSFDVGCQTETPPEPAAQPLHLQYPANLIYAQSMLSISLSQMHQVDMNIQHLRLHLKERTLLAAAAANAACLQSKAPEVVSVPAVATGGDVEMRAWRDELVALRQQLEGVAAGAMQQGGIAPPADAAAAAGAGTDAAPANPADADRLRAHRRRLAVAVKVALVMLLLEVRVGWFFVYFFGTFLYIGGLLDPLLEWFQRYSTQTTLEQQLTALRNRQRNPAEGAAAATLTAADAALGAAGAGGNADAAATQRDAAGGSGQQQQEQSTEAAGGGGGGVGLGGSDTAATDSLGADAAATASSTDPAAADGANAGDAVVEERPPWAQCFFYQLVIMFFGTLLPWWNPDPRYL